MERLNLDWFHDLERREQWVLLIGGLVVILYLFYLLLWRPLAAENAALQERNFAANESLAWMQRSAALVSSKAPATTSSSDGKTLTQILNASVAGNGLRFSLFQPRGDNRVQVWFENSDFSAVFLWLHELQSQNVRVSNASITGSAQNGLVSVSLQLQK